MPPRGRLKQPLKKCYLVLHPDKQGFIKWMQRRQIMLDSDIYDECKAKVLEFWNVWKGTKDKLCEVGQGSYQVTSKLQFTRHK